MGKQVGESHKGFPEGRGAGEAPVKTRIEYKRFSRDVTYGSEIPYGMAVQEWLRKVPYFSRACEISHKVMGNGQSLAELRPAQRVLDHLIENCVCVVVKTLQIAAREQCERVLGTAEIQFRAPPS